MNSYARGYKLEFALPAPATLDFPVAQHSAAQHSACCTSTAFKSSMFASDFFPRRCARAAQHSALRDSVDVEAGSAAPERAPSALDTGCSIVCQVTPDGLEDMLYHVAADCGAWATGVRVRVPGRFVFTQREVSVSS